MKLKILVVEQESHYLRCLIGLLVEVGFNVDSCCDGEATYRKLKNSVRPVDLLIIDLECIQEVDRFGFLKILKEREFCKNTKLIITTNSLIDERLDQVQKELAIGACFNKARPLEELVCIVTDILPPGGQNLREFRRILARVLVKCAVGDLTQLHYSANVSQGGIFIRNAQPEPVGTIVHLAFNLPGSSFTLRAKAKVARIVQNAPDGSSLRYETFPTGNGLVFLEMTEEHRSMLNEFLDQAESRIFGSANESAKMTNAEDYSRLGKRQPGKEQT
jgi:CheY-like chemotaxis protein